jgi:hypothetical protein
MRGCSSTRVGLLFALIHRNNRIAAATGSSLLPVARQTALRCSLARLPREMLALVLLEWRRASGRWSDTIVASLNEQMRALASRRRLNASDELDDEDD